MVAWDALLPPGEITTTKVRLDKNLFPEIWTITLWMFKHLEISMRSCFAQSGIHILGKFFDYMDMDDIIQLHKDGHVNINVSVINRWLSDVRLQEWWAFFRLYFRPAGQFITGNKLYTIIKEGKLKVEWAYGKTRSLVWANIPDVSKEMTRKTIEDACAAKELKEDEVDEALTLKLYLNDNIYIPDNKKWILIESKKNLVDILQPFDINDPRHVEHNFNIGETHYVDFWEYFGAIIYQGYDGWWHHIISPLIDPGFAWPIRTEIVKGDEFNNFIELHIYHKDW